MKVHFHVPGHGTTAEQKQIIRLAYVEELSQSEIAKKLSIPLGTVKSRTRLAFRAIRQELETVL